MSYNETCCNIKDAEIERLGRELAECQAQTAKDYHEEANNTLAKFWKLEAQCAAMRAIMEKIAIPENEPAWPVLTRLDFKDARAALSPDAGQKVLGVVMAAIAVDMDTGDGLRELRDALDALGWKP